MTLGKPIVVYHSAFTVCCCWSGIVLIESFLKNAIICLPTLLACLNFVGLLYLQTPIQNIVAFFPVCDNTLMFHLLSQCHTQHLNIRDVTYFNKKFLHQSIQLSFFSGVSSYETSLTKFHIFIFWCKLSEFGSTYPQMSSNFLKSNTPIFISHVSATAFSSVIAVKGSPARILSRRETRSRGNTTYQSLTVLKYGASLPKTFWGRTARSEALWGVNF